MATRFRLNGEMVTAAADGDTPLLYVLRNDFGLNSPKFGCGKAQCGSCRVIVGGEAVPSCVVPLADVAGADVETLARFFSTLSRKVKKSRSCENLAKYSLYIFFRGADRSKLEFIDQNVKHSL